jgi:hypothetical protein
VRTSAPPPLPSLVERPDERPNGVRALRELGLALLELGLFEGLHVDVAVALRLVVDVGELLTELARRARPAIANLGLREQSNVTLLLEALLLALLRRLTGAIIASTAFRRF